LDDIWPPTSQNQASIEDDLHRFVASRLDLDDQHLTWPCEQAIRNYDPCISCPTHFLDLTVDRTRPGRTRCDEGCQGAPLRAVQVRWVPLLPGKAPGSLHDLPQHHRQAQLAGHQRIRAQQPAQPLLRGHHVSSRGTSGKLSPPATSAARAPPGAETGSRPRATEALAEAASTGHRFSCIKLSYSHLCERRAASKRKGPDRPSPTHLDDIISEIRDTTFTDREAGPS
jgi:hypothetical protein